jgi:hypothetical protein
MTFKRLLYFWRVFATGLILLASIRRVNAQQPTGETISIGNNDIAGVVASTRSPSEN